MRSTGYGEEEMKNFVSFMILFVMVMPAMAATPTATGRLGAKSPVAAANRVSPAKMASMSVNLMTPTATENLSDKSSVRVEDNDATIPEKSEPEKDRREKEKAACIQNNIGVGNMFVWASRYSNINDYSTMIEDTENPENNTCFVKVSLKSADPKIDLGDIKSQYFEMGRDITCGSWVDEDKIEKRILDAKKNVRTWATVGGAVGGAAVGVGSMELFGNRLIGGAVEGQKALSDDELLRSQLLVLNKDKPAQYNEIMKHLKSLKTACEDSSVWVDGANKPDECDTIKYDYLLSTQTASN